MSDLQRISLDEQNVGQAIASLKKGSYLLKYGRRGKPKFCPFRLSNDEKTVIWYVQKKEKQLPLSHVSKIMPGQRTAVFQRYPRPEKEYQSFSLLYGNRSLDVICKDKGEAEIWFVALRALISKNNCQIWSTAIGNDNISSDGSSSYTRTKSHSVASNSSSDIVYEDSDNNEPQNTQQKLGRAFSDLLLYTESEKYSPQNEFTSKLQSPSGLDDHYARTSADSSHLSLTSGVSSSSHISLLEDLETPHDVFIWGEGTGDGSLGGTVKTIKNSNSSKTDAHFPKALKSTMALDARKASCGRKHAVLVTKHGELYSWGDGSGGRLGHGIESDALTPKPVTSLNGSNIEATACGDYHTCAVTQSGDLYTWGDVSHNSGILGQGLEFGRWTPRQVKGQLEGMHITFISCGPWHTAAVASEGLLFTFGDGTFGALGHGNNTSTCRPRAVEALKGLRTVRVSCGVWHTAAIVEVGPDRNLFTWGNGDKGQLGHGDKVTKLFPSCVVSLHDKSFSQVACGESMTVALTTTGQVYTMGKEANHPLCIEGKLNDTFVEEISCGSHHVAVLTSKSEVYTWGKGTKGQLGHGDTKDKNTPTLVKALSETQVKSVLCGSNVTMAICVHKQVCTAELSMCSGCHSPFNFKRKRHNCYNCGLVFCTPCSSKKSLKASLAPDTDRPYRVCDDCYSKLHKEELDTKSSYLPPKGNKGNVNRKPGPDHRPQGLLSRLSSFDSFKRSSSQLLKTESSQDLSNSHALSSHNQSFRRECSLASNSECSGRTVASLPGSVQSSPNHSTSLSSGAVSIELPEAKEDVSKRMNDDLLKEIATLREQVEFLSNKSQALESELERTSRQLKEATKQAVDEGAKAKAAKEVIKTLTTQAFQMSET